MRGLNESIATGNSFTLDTSTALLRANGTKDTNTYLTTASAASTYLTTASALSYGKVEFGNFNIVMTGAGSSFTTANINISWRKAHDGNYGMVSFLIPPFTITLGTVSPNNIKSN